MSRESDHKVEVFRKRGFYIEFSYLVQKGTSYTETASFIVFCAKIRSNIWDVARRMNRKKRTKNLSPQRIAKTT